MKSFAHWTPEYIWARARELLYHRHKPENPWLTRLSVELLEELLKPTDVALEYGGGRSTPWIAKRVKHLTSVDDNQAWHEIVKTKIADKGASNVSLLYRPKDADDADGDRAGYVRAAEKFSDGELDFCLVDGMYRDYCALAAVDKLRSGGLLVIDNANWFLPSQSKSPNSVPLGNEPSSAAWKLYFEKTIYWRRIWTYSGVSATLLMFKP